MHTPVPQDTPTHYEPQMLSTDDDGVLLGGQQHPIKQAVVGIAMVVRRGAA